MSKVRGGLVEGNADAGDGAPENLIGPAWDDVLFEEHCWDCCARGGVHPGETRTPTETYDASGANFFELVLCVGEGLFPALP